MKKNLSCLVSFLVLVFLVIGMTGCDVFFPESGNAYLKAITVSSGTIGPVVSYDETVYTLDVDTSVTEVTISPEAVSSGATESVSPDQPMTLTEGANTATITIEAEDGSELEYTLTVNQVDPSVVEITGTWTDPVYFSTITVSADEIDFGFYTADIVEFSNTDWNAGETSSATGNRGYAVIEYTSAPSWNPDLAGKFMVMRWKNLTGSAMDYSEGYDSVNGAYFDTAAEAKAGADSSYFSWYTSTELQ